MILAATWTSAVSISVAAFIVAMVLTGVIRRFALASGIMDVPNNRSSHVRATPRGGGLAIVAAMTLASVVLAAVHAMDWRLLMALCGGLAIAAIGYVDDRRQLSARVRLAVHFASALWALGWLGGLAPLQLGGLVIQFGWMGYVPGAIGIVWVLNLFNFMDGIDGIAASEAIFVTWGTVLATVISADHYAIPVASIAFGSACLGFLIWNWPPARIFMGDVGSGYLGYVIAVLAVAAARENSVVLLMWLILGGLFFVDATVTLARRLARGKHAYVAHRSHAYQILARRWKAHRPVTIAVWTVNVVWLLPWGTIALMCPAFAGWAVLAALVPVAMVVLALGAGGLESEE